MSSDERIRKRGNIRVPMLIFGFGMTLFFIVLGAWILLDKTFLANIPTDFRQPFAIMVLIYGSYRGWRVYAEYF